MGKQKREKERDLGGVRNIQRGRGQVRGEHKQKKEKERDLGGVRSIQRGRGQVRGEHSKVREGVSYN